MENLILERTVFFINNKKSKLGYTLPMLSLTLYKKHYVHQLCTAVTSTIYELLNNLITGYGIHPHQCLLKNNYEMPPTLKKGHLMTPQLRKASPARLQNSVDSHRSLAFAFIL